MAAIVNTPQLTGMGTGTLNRSLVVACASDELFKAQDHRDAYDAVCIDLDASMASGPQGKLVHKALDWASQAASANKRVIVVGKTRNLAKADKFRGRNYVFLDRDGLPEEFRLAEGDDLARGVMESFARYRSGFTETSEGFVAKSRSSTPAKAPHAPARPERDRARREALRAALEKDAPGPLTPEQKRDFDQYMHRG